MPSIEQIVEKIQTKLLQNTNQQKIYNEQVFPLADNFFHEKFGKIFEQTILQINSQIGMNVINYSIERNNKITLQGYFHRIIFQKGKVELNNNIVTCSIIPIYMWKGITKHFGKISFSINLENETTKWHIPFNNVEDYALNIFDKFIEDDDFSM